jgi:NADPH2:quinone reductase
MKAVFVEQPGGVENLKYADVPKPSPSPGQALVKIVASGVNYIDIYFRKGVYPSPPPPPIMLGSEGAGTVEAIGPDVTNVAVGDRVAYAMARGSYAEYAVVPAWQLVKIPASVDFETAAAAMLQGMTAHYLTHSTYPLKPGDSCLIHAAAGGTGQLIVQMAKMLGAHVIGTVGTEEKAKQAKEAGADEVIVYTREDFAAKAKGVHVVYDSVGQSTFMKSLDCLRPRGMLVSFGNASGAVTEFSPLTLSQKGSLFLTRPTLLNYTATVEELDWRANDVLTWLAQGKLKLHIHKVYPLSDAAQAHNDLESRKTTGKLLLRVG